MFFHDDLAPHFEPSPRLAAAVSRRSSGRCFRTTADGRIPLTTDWPALFAAARALGPLALQTRHAYARLVATVELPAFAWTSDLRGAGAADGSLQLQLDDRHRAWGRLATCACCGAPGRLELQNEHGLECLQLCPLAEYAPSAWSDFLDEASPAAFASLHRQEPRGAIARESALRPLPYLPIHALPVAREAGILAPLLTALGDEKVPLRCHLSTRETRHTRDLIARRVTVENGLLTAGENATRVQLALPAVRSLALSTEDDVCVLHASGPGDTSLLAFTSGDDPAADVAWRAALRRAFPGLR